MTNFEVYAIGEIKNDEDGVLIKIAPKYLPALKGLEGFSHINVIWWFSGFDHEEARKTVETAQPYKKAPAVMGIFATRSPVRPNPIALTAVEVIGLDCQKGLIQIAYIDADDGSPVLDIKPYTPSLDRVETPVVPEWCGHWPKSLEQSACFAWEDEFNF